MNRRIKFGAAAMASALAVGGALVLGAAPASAATACKTNTKEFPTDFYNADVTVKLCVVSRNGGHFADGYVSWNEAGSNKFDKFVVQVRLERNDADIAVTSCSMTSSINSLYQGDDFCGRGSFASGSGGWTADGKVTYNINNDGEGDMVWELTGSPSIS
ncbi:hypothetical protein ACSNOB_11690 [Micromonospora sp. URMC 106]|uniref:hypothetical protein n=1 Tax=Micromonospora sp. URMC 106 TaxID=3423408 RepID=UPI003F1DAC57